MKVVSLIGKTKPEATSQECAARLREALAEAEAGRLTGCFIVTTDVDRATMSTWVTGTSFMALMGAVVCAQRDMIEEASE